MSVILPARTTPGQWEKLWFERLVSPKFPNTANTANRANGAFGIPAKTC
jgi:hypothetical protein